MFTKIQAKSVSDEIVDQVIAAIFGGKLLSGSRLPAERALSQEFGVGRQAVREAIQKLIGMGLLEVRGPQGTFVKSLSAEVLTLPLRRLLNGDAGKFLRFLDIRKWMEAMTAAEAAERATVEEVARIEATLPVLRAAAEAGDRESLDQADMAFHMAIVEAAHNSMLGHMADTFRDVMWSSHGLRLAVLRAQNLGAICEEHLAVAAAIRARSRERARDAMLHHIEMSRRRVEEMGLDAGRIL
jgi:GntR family transcriptional repressor for pyruvate dehydrogenase complex